MRNNTKLGTFQISYYAIIMTKSKKYTGCEI